MKLLKRSPLLAGIVAFTILIVVISLVFKDTTYAEYSNTAGADTPVISYFFRGLAEGVFPWSNSGIKDGETLVADDSDNSVDTLDEQSATGLEATKSNVDTLDISGNDVPGIDISGNDISGNDISGNSDITYELTEVTDDYFTDALFIGDSRTVGLSEYCEELDTRATFYSKVSLTIYTVLDKEFIKTEDDRNKISVREALSENQFAKIYIMLGLNEIGTGTTETFCQAYSEVIDQIRELQPDAIIYIQGIMHVTEAKSSTDKHFNNQNINERNEAISQLANDRDIFYIDMNESVDDENGNLLAELSFDDVHLKASAYERWHQYLLTHAIVKE